MKEKILGVAWCRGGGLVCSMLAPARHVDLLRELQKLGVTGPIQQDEQGFITSEGRFVNRYVAARIAYHSKQLRHGWRSKMELFSEDVW